MISIKHLFLFSSVLLLLSCKRNMRQDAQVVMGHYCDTTYYASGKIQLIVCKANGYLNGSTKEYFENGNLRRYVFWTNNKKNGPDITYGADGKILDKFFFENDVFVGNQYENFPNGKIRIFTFFDSSGKMIFRREYDSLGNSIHDEGSWTPLFEFSKSDTVERGDTLKVKVCHFDLPEFDQELYYSVGELEPRSWIHVSINPLNRCAEFNYPVLGSGTLTIHTKYIITDMRLGRRVISKSIFTWPIR